uniref:Calcium-binding mitochondrial carrier protein SCaMC-1 n=1 Tax=Elaeophora elaphi TaxID=1147741 RepID=A0A158Q7X1_9BILA
MEVSWNYVVAENLSLLSEVVAQPYTVSVEPSAPLLNEVQVFLFQLNMYGIPAEKEKGLRELYEQLDVNKDGTIDIRDLTNALKQGAPHIPSIVIPELFAQMDRLNDDIITFPEFVQYAIEHEKKLEIVFRDLDKSRNGYFGVQEIKKYCEDLGLPITDTKAQGIVEWMARTNSASVNFSEFKDFMLLYPRSKPEDIAKFWKHNLMIDIGGGSQIPEDFSQKEIASGFWWKHLVAGGVAGSVSRTCTAPLDRVKIYLQVHATLLNRLRFPKAAKLLYEEGGLKSFWRGNGVNVAKIAPESAIKFLTYDLVKRLIIRQRDQGHKLQIFERLAAGSAAGVVSQTVVYPLEVLKTRLALRRSDQLESGLVDLAAKMYRNEGFSSFYKGVVPNLIGIIPYAGIDLAVYETLKSYYLSNCNAHPLRDVIAFPICGACSSICATLASYPFALVRTRLQALAISGNLTQPDTMNGQIQYIWNRDGLYGFYRGLTANLVKAVPAVAISYHVYEHMRSVRDTGLLFPSTLSSDEKRLKEVFEKLRTIRKAIAATGKVNVHATVGDNLKTERQTTKRHLQKAEKATEEVKRKVLIGAVSFKKVDEKKDSFKRSSLIGRRRDIDKTKTDSDTVINTNTELLPPTADNSKNKPFSLDNQSETKKKVEESSENFDTLKPLNDFEAGKNTISDVSDICKSASSSASQKISTSRTSNSSDICLSPVSNSFDTYKARDGPSSFDNYRPVSVGSSSDLDTSGPSSFDIYKPTSIGDDEFDNYKPGSSQSFSFDATNHRPLLVLSNRDLAGQGPCLYIRGYDLVADSLRNVFSKYGVINRIFVEERQKSAFITYATTEEAETAIKEMDGNMVNGITLRVSFARRQNQCGDSGRFRSSSKSFSRCNDGDEREYSNRSRGERSSSFRGNEHIRPRGEKNGRGRGRRRMYESRDSLLTASESNDEFWSDANKVPSERSTVEASCDKGDSSSARKQSTGKTGEPSAEKGDKEEDSFDTYKSTISASEADDLKVITKKEDFDTYKPFSDRSDSSNHYQGNFEKRRSIFEHLGVERQGSFDDDRYHSIRGDGCGSGTSRRNRGSPLWRSRKRSDELRNVDHCSTGNLDIDQKNSWLTSTESGVNWTSSDHHGSEHSKNVSANRESESKEKDNDGKDDFCSASSRQSSSGSGESWPFSAGKSGSDHSFRESTRGDHRSGRSGDRGGGFRRQRRDFDNKSTWPDEESKVSSCDEWPYVDSKPSPDSWLLSSGDKLCNSPPPPPISEVQVAWSEATKKTSKEMTTLTEKEDITVMQRKPEIRKQVSYDEDDPFA